jgi:hypothetical protein
MKQTASARLYILSAVGAGALAAATGLAFAGWMEHAPAILTTLAQEGLAWCF